MATKKIILLASLLLFPVQASAQDSNTALLDKIDRLEREMNTLQQAVYRGATPPPGVSTAPEGDSMALDEQLRTLTGRVEELEHQNRQLAEKLDAFIMQQYNTQPQATTPAPSAATAPTTSQSPFDVPALNLDTEGQTSTVAPAPGTTPTAPANPLADPAETLYQEAFSQLRQANYTSAEGSFKKFIDTYGDNPLGSNAYYWLGETYYAQKNYEQSAVQFLRGYKKFPKGNKAPDSLLKLAVSLASLGKEKEACTSLNKLFKEFPDAPSAVTQRAKEEAGRNHCQ